MTSTTDADDGGGSPGTEDAPAEENTERERPGPSVCSVCQQPLDEDWYRTDRGEPVHAKCHAAARCGISLE